jgi:hypothetical protein
MNGFVTANGASSGSRSAVEKQSLVQHHSALFYFATNLAISWTGAFMVGSLESDWMVEVRNCADRDVLSSKYVGGKTQWPGGQAPPLRSSWSKLAVICECR